MRKAIGGLASFGTSTNVRFRAPAIAKPIFQTTQFLSTSFAATLLERFFLTPPRSTLPANEAAFLDTGARHRIDSDVGELTAWSWGEGPTALLVHGWGSRASRFRTIAPALLESGWRVVAFDAPGHGLSAGRRSSLPETARAIRYLIDWERERRGRAPRAVIAHSFGSAAVILAQRDGVRIPRNVFLAPSIDFDSYLRRVAGALALNKAVVAAMIGRVERRLGFSWDEIRIDAIARDIAADALIVHDPEDPEVPFADAEQLAAAWSSAELVSVQRLGHRRLLHDAAVVDRIVRFVSAEKKSGFGEFKPADVLPRSGARAGVY
jgi:pimeloyl-ACP methyl ester carboxylesterase